MSPFKKVIPVGPASLTLTEAAGLITVSIGVDVSADGGAVKAKASAEIDVQAQVLIDAGLDLAAAKFPAAATLIQVAKEAIDVELKRI